MITVISQMSAYSVSFLSQLASWLIDDSVALIFVGLGFVSLAFGLVRKLV